MKKTVVISVLVPAVALGSFLSLPQASATAAQGQKEKIEQKIKKADVIEFKDSNIKAMVTLELSVILGRPATDADFTQENLNQITYLGTFAGSALKTLDDLAHMPNLQTVNLAASAGAKTFDTTPLSHLDKLKEFTFWFSDGQLSSLKPFEGKDLTRLEIHAQPIADASEKVVDSLKSLQILTLSYFDLGEAVRDVGSLDDLPALIEITLHTGLTTAPTLKASSKLDYASFSGNNISIAPDLSHSKNLSILSLDRNKIKDYTNIEKMLDLPNPPSIFLAHNLLTTYPDFAAQIRPADLNGNFIVGHGLKFQNDIKKWSNQTLEAGKQIELPIEWVEEGTNFPPFESFTKHQQDFVNGKNMKIETDNDNVSVTAKDSSIVITAKDGVQGKTHVNLSYGGDLSTSFEVDVQ